jgi:hypothetical protein
LNLVHDFFSGVFGHLLYPSLFRFRILIIGTSEKRSTAKKHSYKTIKHQFFHRTTSHKVSLNGSSPAAPLGRDEIERLG